MLKNVDSLRDHKVVLLSLGKVESKYDVLAFRFRNVDRSFANLKALKAGERRH